MAACWTGLPILGLVTGRFAAFLPSLSRDYFSGVQGPWRSEIRSPQEREGRLVPRLLLGRTVHVNHLKEAGEGQMGQDASQATQES